MGLIVSKLCSNGNGRLTGGARLYEPQQCPKFKTRKSLKHSFRLAVLLRVTDPRSETLPGCNRCHLLIGNYFNWLRKKLCCFSLIAIPSFPIT